jgi:uncharacterized protein with FMN-binding domain
MKRIVIWLASTISVVVLLFGYHTSTNQTSQAAGTTPGTTPGSTTGSGGTGTSGTAGSGTAGAGSPPDDPAGGSNGSGNSTGSSGGSGGSNGSSTTSAAAKSYTGAVAQTEWGPVQVKITVKAGKITKVDVVQYPNGNPRDAQINAYALPILVQDTIKAQSAKIDMISGATVTSGGYLQSLQSALDEAGI